MTTNCFTHLRHAAVIFLCMLAQPALADESAAPAPLPALVLGKTTLPEAREIWLNSGATVVGEGHLAIGGGNGVDGLSTVGLPQALLVTVDGVEFESLPVARYAFVDEVLYAISAQLQNGMKKKMAFKDLSDDELSQLQHALTGKYGKPRPLKDLFATKANIFVWDRGANEMVLTVNAISGSNLSLKNKALVKKVEAYTKTECKKHRQKGPGPVTAICL